MVHLGILMDWTDLDAESELIISDAGGSQGFWNRCSLITTYKLLLVLFSPNLYGWWVLSYLGTQQIWMLNLSHWCGMLEKVNVFKLVFEAGTLWWPYLQTFMDRASHDIYTLYRLECWLWATLVVLDVGEGVSFWSRCLLIAISKALMVLSLPVFNGWCILWYWCTWQA